MGRTLLNPEEALVYALADSEELFRGESAEGWELLARWRVCLVHWGRFQDELAEGSAAHAPKLPWLLWEKKSEDDPK